MLVSPSFDRCKLFCWKILILILSFFRIAHLFRSLYSLFFSILSILYSSLFFLFSLFFSYFSTGENFITKERMQTHHILKEKIPRRTLILQGEGFAMNTFLGFNFLLLIQSCLTWKRERTLSWKREREKEIDSER